ncbi:MAG: hypothetical protein OEZ06_26655 [Myxococcales bacterium]|nr:hypothetical protein [Myxococcales bacterium]
MPRIRFPCAVLVVLSCMQWLSACDSHEERCSKGKAAAHAAWEAYLAKLEGQRQEAIAMSRAARTKLEAEWQSKLDADAREKANALNEPNSGAWWRTFNATKQSACANYPKCSELREQMADADDRNGSIAKQAEQAKAARDAISKLPGEPGAALGAVPDDFDYKAELALAREQSAAAVESCSGLPAAAQ